jgi:hypothetical protein
MAELGLGLGLGLGDGANQEVVTQSDRALKTAAQNLALALALALFQHQPVLELVIEQPLLPP